MRETQQSICEWADATFGVPASEASIIERALAEAKELVTACTSEPRAATTQIGWEAADVVIVLARLGRALKIDAVGIACERALDVDLQRASMRTLYNLRLAASAGDRSEMRVHILRALYNITSVVGMVSVNLADAIDAKMAINRERRWKLDGTGHGQHVEDAQDPLEAAPRCPSCDEPLPPGWRVCGACFLREGP